MYEAIENKSTKKLRQPMKSLISKSRLSFAIVVTIVAGFFAVLQATNFLHYRTTTESHAANCVAPSNYPPPPVGGMTYTNWYFDTSERLNYIKATAQVLNNPGNTSNEFLQLYDANIDNAGQYFGIQTTGRVLFTAWNTSDMSGIYAAPGAYAVNGAETGNAFISIRRDFGSLPTGQYTVEVQRSIFDGTGDWFEYFVTFPGQPRQHIGSIRFRRATAGVPAAFRDGGGSWTEFWTNNGNTLQPVPLWQVKVAVTGNNGLVPNSARSTYSSMPNSDIFAESPGGYVNMTLGGNTSRCHPAGFMWQNIHNPPPKPAPVPTAPSATPKATTPSIKTTPKTSATPTINSPTTVQNPPATTTPLQVTNQQNADVTVPGATTDYGAGTGGQFQVSSGLALDSQQPGSTRSKKLLIVFVVLFGLTALIPLYFVVRVLAMRFSGRLQRDRAVGRIDPDVRYASTPRRRRGSNNWWY